MNNFKNILEAIYNQSIIIFKNVTYNSKWWNFTNNDISITWGLKFISFFE